MNYLKLLLSVKYVERLFQENKLPVVFQYLSIVFFLLVFAGDFSSSKLSDVTYPINVDYIALGIFVVGLGGFTFLAKGLGRHQLASYFLSFFVPAKILSWLISLLFIFAALPLAYKLDQGGDGPMMSYVNLIGFILVHLLPFLLLYFKRSETN